ncbi:hypothetical protein [Plantactinospora endophytica]|uniref:CopG-like ribbon-helix-helix domain-containing protein n=1 Tax=Plantactinospora endophytica TaxID=673535 RepID=A0ABQ4EGK2_9ACTN|nr:hypothetical protein [Plantactinospora endophytica]GIG93347.1 hypothetical protein Pen02_82830 [Plantactinospora endophytica]
MQMDQQPRRGRTTVDDGRVLVALGVRVRPDALSALKVHAQEQHRPVAHLLGEMVEQRYSEKEK